jgi:flagellar basal body-associated protein FliL
MHEKHTSHQHTQSPAPIEPKSKMDLYVVAGVAILVVGTMMYVFSNKAAAPTTVNTPVAQETTPAPVEPTPIIPPTPVVYKDGTYTVDGAYTSPAGAETIGITLTLKKNIITSATAKMEAKNPKSIKFQNDFIKNFKPMVVGKNISDLQLGKVSGSSLTPIGFNDALSKIEAKAL